MTAAAWHLPCCRLLRSGELGCGASSSSSCKGRLVWPACASWLCCVVCGKALKLACGKDAPFRRWLGGAPGGDLLPPPAPALGRPEVAQGEARSVCVFVRPALPRQGSGRDLGAARRVGRLPERQGRPHVVAALAVLCCLWGRGNGNEGRWEQEDRSRIGWLGGGRAAPLVRRLPSCRGRSREQKQV
jgi:hypothetical protein